MLRRRFGSLIPSSTSATSRFFIATTSSVFSSQHHQYRFCTTEHNNNNKETLSKNQMKKALKKQKQLEKQAQKQQQKLANQQEENTTSTTEEKSEKDNANNNNNNNNINIPFTYPSFVTTTDAKSFLSQSFEQSSSSTSDIIKTVKPEHQNKISRIGGRITAARDMGKIIFFTIKSDNETLQISYSVNEEKGITKQDIKEIAKKAKAGDIIGAEGVAGVTKKGEPSLFASKIEVLSKYAAIQESNCPSLTGYVKPSDPDILYRYRFVDLMCSSKSQQVFRTRAKVLQSLRKFLDNRDFIEVETPVFHTVPSGAAARPFRTYHESNESDLFLRVAPELYLKQCVVGGLERVYEVGRVFRNEDSDRSHNPEFTSCEFYQAYATYRELIPMTEELIRTICFDALGSSKITVFVKSSSAKNDEMLSQEAKDLIKEAISEEGSVKIPAEGSAEKEEGEKSSSSSPLEPYTIDLSKPFKVVDIIPELESHLGLTFPRPITELDNEQGSEYLKELLQLHKIPLPQPASPAKLFDKLIDHFITDNVIEPTFVIGHPTFMSPLAKEDPANPGVSERFELFINGMEICNSYSELNDPVEQKHRFEQQLKQRVFFNDDEAQCVDETFLKALQSGLPPTAGWGMGIDRLVMLLCECSSIRDVVLFPLLRSSADSRDSKRKREAASFFGFDPFMTKFILNSLEAEFLKRGGIQGANLVRNVHSAVDSIVCEETQRQTAHKNIDCFFEKAAAVAAAAVSEMSSSSSAKTTTASSNGGKDIVERSKNDKICDPKAPNAECGLMALLLLGGLRDGQYHVQQKSEQFLLDVAFQALCDPSVASSWWWKK